MTRLRDTIADLFVSSAGARYTQRYAWLGGFIGHMSLSFWVTRYAEEGQVSAWWAVALVALVFAGAKELRDYKLATHVGRWQRIKDWAVDATAYACGLWVALADGLLMLTAATGASAAIMAAGVLLWKPVKPKGKATRD